MSPVESSQQRGSGVALQHSSQLRPRKHPTGAFGLWHACVKRSQVAAFSVPARQVDSPETLKPSLQVGLHACPLASDDLQVPKRPLRGGFWRLHGKARQDTAFSSPLKHDVSPDTVYPTLQLYLQSCPCCSSAVQFPLPPKIGGALESQGLRGCVGALDSIKMGR